MIVETYLGMRSGRNFKVIRLKEEYEFVPISPYDPDEEVIYISTDITE